jgi:hypothetical protein
VGFRIPTSPEATHAAQSPEQEHKPADLSAYDRLLAGTPAGAAHQVGLGAAGQEFLTEQQKDEARRAAEHNETIGAATKLADASREAGQAALDDSKAAAARDAAARADEDRHRLDIRKDYQDRQDKAFGELAKLQAAGIDTNRYFMNQSTPQKIMAGIAVAMGGIGAGALGPRGTRGDNTALKIIQQAQQDDLDAQKTDMQNRLAIMGKKIDMNREGFSADLATHDAQVDSRKAAYAQTTSMIDKALAQTQKDSAQQQSLLKLKADYQADNEAKDESDQRTKYDLKHAAEKVVGGGGGSDAKKRFQDSIEHITDDAIKAGKPIPPRDELYAAAAIRAGLPGPPGVTPANVSMPAKAPAGAARLANPLLADKSNLKALDDLSNLVKEHGSSFFGEAGGKQAQLEEQLKAAGIDVPVNFWTSTNKTQAAIDARRALIKQKINDRVAIMHGASPEGEDDADSLGAERQ